MTPTVLVTGATGTVGRATIAALREASAQPVAFVRDPERAAQALGAGTPLRFGDLTKEWSLAAALDGVDAVLLCSGHDPAMAQLQLTAARAIAASSVRRVVKISGSPVSVRPDSPARTGREHWEIEEALRATVGDREVVAVRPNAFMDNFLGQAPAIAHGALPGPDGLSCVSFVDTRDIGRVAAAALLAEQAPDAVLEVTGPEKLTLFDVARTLSAVLGRPIVHQPLEEDVMRQGLLAMGRPEWLVDHMLELAALMREPKAAEITDTVERVTGRPPVALEQFLTENAAAFPAAA
jgi:uncharacterized protein YbjT (DUF2867 family)